MKEQEKDRRMMVTRALLREACHEAPCIWGGNVFDGVKCDNCPIKSAIDFIEKERKEQ